MYQPAIERTLSKQKGINIDTQSHSRLSQTQATSDIKQTLSRQKVSNVDRLRLLSLSSRRSARSKFNLHENQTSNRKTFLH